MKIISKILCALLIVGAFGVLMYSFGLRHQRSKDKIKKTKNSIIALNRAIDYYKADTGNYPSEEHGLNLLIQRYDVKNWNGPYWEMWKILPDGWGNSFKYKLINNIPIVISSGADGTFGTYDDIETGIR